MTKFRFATLIALLGTVLLTPLYGQVPAPLRDQLKRIFDSEDFDSKSFGPAKWLPDGDAYTTVEPSESVEDAHDIVRYDTKPGAREVLVSASTLRPPDATRPLEIDDYAWSSDRARLLVFTNTVRVWRRNTRGDYWVLDVASGALRKLGGVAPTSSLMFAKFSPDGTRVAYVVANNLYVETLTTGAVTTLTESGSPTTIFGTSDWVYEEEFGLRDGFRWNPDGKRIAFWNFDAEGIGEFTIINNTDELYPTLLRIPYPKAGTTNSAVRIGVVSAAGGEMAWMKVPGRATLTWLAWSGR